MGKSRRRQTAKTGDKGIYNKRDDASDNKKKHDDDDDPMYDKVDQFHNQQDFLKLDQDKESDESEDEFDRQEAVMDLGVGGDSSNEDDDDDGDSSSDEDNVPKRKQSSPHSKNDEEGSEDEEGLSSDDDDDDEAAPLKNVRDWGKQKTDYYNGDTADLEIGQEEDDALVEEEAAKEIQAARYEQMKEEDFVLSDDEEADEDGKEVKAGATTTTRDFKSKAEKIKFLDRKHPELLPLVSHFTDMLRDWKEQTDVVTRALLEGEKGTPQAVGATKLGQQYLLNKAMLQSSAGLNLAAYLLLKSEQADADLDPAWIQSHPVMKHLHKINALTHKLEDKIEKKVPGLEDQLDKLVKASALLTRGEVELDNEDDEDEDTSETGDAEVVTQDDDMGADATEKKDGSPEDGSDDSESENEDDPALDEQARARSVTNEARFGLRATEVVAAQGVRRRRQAPASDFGDAEEGTAEAGKALAATLNSIEQRSAARKRKVSPMADTIDEPNEDDEIRRGLAMMEEELGPASDDDGGMEDDASGDERDAFDPEVEGDDFYASMTKKSKSKKAFKKNLYAVKPKYPRMEEEVDGERSLSKAIMKNRGLVPHKNKLNRNPRVKKREQYRKALIRRKGAVREVRTEEGHKYGGESTGIKTGISRSHRFAS
eukprot:scaffold2632_cov158-Amphora_coffeaeformis.AAC.9